MRGPDPGTTTSTGATPKLPRFRVSTQDPLRSGARTAHGGDRGRDMADATLTITLDDGNVYVDVQCDQGDDLSVVEAIGLLEMAKAILLAPEAGE